MTLSINAGGEQLEAVRARVNAVEQMCTVLAREVAALTADVTELVERPLRPPLSVSVEEAASLLGVSRTKMFTLLDAAQIPSVKVGSRRLVPRRALDEFMAGRDLSASG